MLEPEHFIAPKGELTEGMYPGEDVEELVTAWLQDAQARTSDETRQAAWVYHRAYTHVANRMHAGLASERKGDQAASIDPSQLKYWQRKADAALTAYRAGATSTSGVTEVRSAW